MSSRPDEPLSGDHLENFLKGYGASIVPYSTLGNYKTLASLFQRRGRYHFVVLFNESGRSEIGHWTVVLDRGDGRYELFDSLGFPVDGVNQEMGVESRQLGRLFERSGADATMTWLTRALQTRTSMVCGRLVVLRILCAKMTNEQFHDTMLAAKRVWGSIELASIMMTALPNV